MRQHWHQHTRPQPGLRAVLRRPRPLLRQLCDAVRAVQRRFPAVQPQPLLRTVRQLRLRELGLLELGRLLRLLGQRVFRALGVLQRVARPLLLQLPHRPDGLQQRVHPRAHGPNQLRRLRQRMSQLRMHPGAVLRGADAPARVHRPVRPGQLLRL